MRPSIKKPVRLFVLLPVFGSLVFVVLYCIAAYLYPGGSQADKNSIGFSWMNNYWCNLLNEFAINGEPNTARPFAVAAMGVLCFSLLSFWFSFTMIKHIGSGLRLMIRLSGVLAMATAFFLLSGADHDMIVNLASFFGLVATIGTFVGLYRLRWKRLLAIGLLNIVLVGVNNYLYHTAGMIVYLPLVQKITFACFLLWICCVDIKLYKAFKGTMNNHKSPS